MLTREQLIDKIEAFLAGKLNSEDLGWWAFDLLVEPGLVYEPGHERLLKDTLQLIQNFHDTEPLMVQFYPEREDLLYLVNCLKRVEYYNPKRIPHWNV